MGRIVAILAGCGALLVFAAPAAADPVDTPPGVPEVFVLTDADGMLVHGVTSTAIFETGT